MTRLDVHIKPTKTGTQSPLFRTSHLLTDRRGPLPSKMLSNPLHRFSPYQSLPSSTLLTNGLPPPHHMQHGGLDGLHHGSHHGSDYSMHALQQHVGVANPRIPRGGPQGKHRQHPYGPRARSASASGPVRRRISRACDQCNQLRTKCDGQRPCAHCLGKSTAETVTRTVQVAE